ILKLRKHLSDFTFYFFQFFCQPCFFCAGILDAFQWQKKIAQGRLYHRSGFWRLIIRVHDEGLSIQQQSNGFDLEWRQAVYGVQHIFDLFIGGNIRLAPQVASLPYEFEFLVHHFEIAIIEAVVALEILIERLGPGSKHDGLAALVSWHVFMITHSMPEFVCNKRQKGMEQTE